MKREHREDEERRAGDPPARPSQLASPTATRRLRARAGTSTASSTAGRAASRRSSGARGRSGAATTATPRRRASVTSQRRARRERDQHPRPDAAARRLAARRPRPRHADRGRRGRRAGRQRAEEERAGRAVVLVCAIELGGAEEARGSTPEKSSRGTSSPEEEGGHDPDGRDDEQAARSLTSAAVRVAVISDIHANLPALEAVREAIDGSRPTRSGASATWSGTARSRTSAARSSQSGADVCLVGNHDLGVLGARPRRLLAGRGRGRPLDGRRARGRARRYLGRARRARSTGRSSTTGARAIRSGSTCSARGRGLDAPATEQAARRSSVTATFRSRSGGEQPTGGRPGRDGDRPGRERWLLNPGSVGQPRDGDPRAAWLLLDLDAQKARLPPRRVPRRGGAGGDPRARAARGARRAARARRLGRQAARSPPNSTLRRPRGRARADTSSRAL